MEEIEGFRYRAKDALQAVTRTAIQEARLKDVRVEIFNSNKLRSYFDDNPQDLQALRHDKPLHTVKSSEMLKHVPQYIVPQSLRSQRYGSRKKQQQHRSGNSSISLTEKKAMKRRADPLKSFEFAGLADKKKKKKRK